MSSQGKKRPAAETEDGSKTKKPCKKSARERFPCTLAKPYDPAQANVFDGTWCWSLKLDGVRAWWCTETKQLLSRANKPFTIPPFLDARLRELNLPLDGELFSGPGNFAAAVSTCRKTTSMDPDEWKARLTFEVFDLIDVTRDFTERLLTLQTAVPQEDPFLHVVPQTVIKDESFDLFGMLDQCVAEGHEGLMLRRMTDGYSHSRSSGLRKCKKFHDVEVRVVEMIGGKGKFEGVLGAVLVVDTEGNTCKIGSGFSNEQRAAPPFEVGDEITMKFFERTKADKRTGNVSYRFPTFSKVKDEIEG